MIRRELQRYALAWLALSALLVAASATSEAQTWRWQYLTRTPNTPPLAAQSTVVVGGGQLRLTYSVRLDHHQVAIESCHAALSDVESATTVLSQTRAYLLVRLKPARMAACASGHRSAVVLPTSDARDVRGVVEAINRSCCATPAIAVVTPTARPAASSSPTPRASATPAAPRIPPVANWVETHGAFTFVRVRNTGREPVAIRDIRVSGCHGVDIGCGASARAFVIDSGHIVTIATVATDHTGTAAIFHYRYTAALGADSSTHDGTSIGTAQPGQPRMSLNDVRTAQANALDGLRSPAPHSSATAVAQTIGPARLVKRGSSRLAIGVTGTALVRLVIAANGTPQEATIVSISDRRLAAAAIETAVSSTYAPATQNGRPIAAKYIATFSFDGEDPALAAVPLWKRSPSPALSGGPASAEPAVPAAAPTESPTAPAPVPTAPASATLPPPPTPPAVMSPAPTEIPATAQASPAPP